MATRAKAGPRPEPKVTEADLYDLLRRRLCQNGGNGPQQVLVPGVRSAAGFDARRTIDAVGLGLWPSRGMWLTAYEMKCSRSDWLRELKDPAKAEEFAALVDRFVVVASDGKIVKDGELPEGWGLMVKQGSLEGGTAKLVEAQAPLLLHQGRDRRELPPGFRRSFLVPLLRAANAIPPEERERMRREAGESAKFQRDMSKANLERLEGEVKAFEEAAGVRITERRSFAGGAEEAASRGKAFRLVLGGQADIARLEQRAQQIAASAERLAENARKVAEGDPEGVGF